LTTNRNLHYKALQTQKEEGVIHELPLLLFGFVNKKAHLGGLFYLLLVFGDNLGRLTEEDCKEEQTN